MWAVCTGALAHWVFKVVCAAVAAAAAVMCVFACARGGSRAVPCAVVGVSVAVTLVSSVLFWSAWQGDCSAVAERCGQGGAEVELLGDPVQRDYGTVSVAQMHVRGHWCLLRVKWPQGVKALPAGHALRVFGALLPAGDDDGGRWNHRNGYVGMLDAKRVEEAGVAHGLRGAVAGFRDASFERIRALGGDQAALLAGVLLGNRTLYAQTELEQAFQTTGLAHLMAVSGTHLAVVSALAGWIVSIARMQRCLRMVFCGVLLGLYVALTAFSASALRAFAMCMSGLAAGLFGRRGHVVSALGACVLVFIALHPPVAYSLGFQLSVLAVLGLVLFSPLASAWSARFVPKHLESVADGVGVTLAATAATLPLSVPLFVQLPLIAPASTLLAAPLVTVVLVLGVPALCLAPVLPGVSGILLGCSGAAAGLCAWLVRGLADLPFACIPLDANAWILGLACFAGAVVLWVLWPQPGGSGGAVRTLASFAVATSVPLAVLVAFGLGGLSNGAEAVLPGFESPDEVVMLDVGQGDAMLVRSGEAAILVDTGEDGAVLKRDLARNGIVRLDAVYITHKDADHCGALSALAGVVPVGHVFIHADLLDFDGEAAVLEAARWVTAGRGAEGVRPGSAARVGAFTITVLSPRSGGTSENADSLVSLLEYDADGDGVADARGLLTGDAEHEAIDAAVERCGQVDFVKVGHHGSRGAFTGAQLASLKPRIALIGVGADNKYGHPTLETLNLLQDAGAQVFRTDTDGDIRMRFSKERIGVTVQKRH